MKIVLGQINPTIGDLEGNFSLAKKVMENAPADADLVVFPELAVCGYPPKDLLDKPKFVSEVISYAHKWAELSTSRTGLLFGSVRSGIARDGESRALQNVAFYAIGGSLSDVQAKSLLPTYDVFLEDRHFTPAWTVDPIVIKGTKVGVCICEDIWNDKDFWRAKSLYGFDPVHELVRQGSELIINLSASPYSIGKHETRKQMLSFTAKKYERPLVYINQVGGNDDVLYDGRSLAFDAQGEIVSESKAFEEDAVSVEVQPSYSNENRLFAVVTPPETQSGGFDSAEVRAALVMGIRDYARKCGFKQVVLGLSGGIDSALVAVLAAEALGPKNVLGIGMPSRYSSQGSVDDARRLAENLGIDFEIHPIKGIYDAFLSEFGADESVVDLSLENSQARIRGMILMAHSNKYNRLLLTTGNKSEIAVGYCTLYGDTCGGLAVISDVFKTKVYELATYINKDREIIPSDTITKPPSAELRPGQKDTDSLPPYDVLDAILAAYIERQKSIDEICLDPLVCGPGAPAGIDAKVIERVCRMVDKNEYKRKQLAPGLRITHKAFGSGRIMPIAQRWHG